MMCAVYRFAFILFCLPLLIIGFSAFGQDDLLDLLESESEPVTNYTIATFKTSKVVNIHSVETHAEGVLQFLIGHRFGRVNSGVENFFGIDNATIRLGLEYGVLDWLNVGIGRSSFEKTYDGMIKCKILRQSSGAKKMPVTLTGVATMAIKTIPWPEPERKNYNTSRLYYTFSALIARKFGDYVSIQLAPTLVHRNLVKTREDRHDVFVMGYGSSVRITGSLRLNAEYNWIIPGQIASPLYGEEVRDALSIGIDLETGGHVFQLMFTNSRGMIEKMVMTETTGSWGKGDIHFGFNISRVFTIYDKNKRTSRKSNRD